MMSTERGKHLDPDVQLFLRDVETLTEDTLYSLGNKTSHLRENACERRTPVQIPRFDDANESPDWNTGRALEPSCKTLSADRD